MEDAVGLRMCCWGWIGNARYFERGWKSGVAVQIEFCGRANRVSLILYLNIKILIRVAKG